MKLDWNEIQNQNYIISAKISLRFDCLLLYCYDRLCFSIKVMLPTVFQKGSCKKKIPVFVFLWQPDIWNGLNHNISIGITKLFSSFFPHFVISIQMSILQQLYNCTSNSYIKSGYFFLSMHLRDYILKRLAKYNLKLLIFIEIRVKFSVNNYKILNLFFIPSFSFF